MNNKIRFSILSLTALSGLTLFSGCGSESDGASSKSLGDLFRTASKSLNSVGDELPSTAIYAAYDTMNCQTPDTEQKVLDCVVANYESDRVNPETASGFMLMMAKIMDGIASNEVPAFGNSALTYSGKFTTDDELCNGGSPEAFVAGSCKISYVLQSKKFSGGSNWENHAELKVCLTKEVDLTWDGASSECSTVSGQYFPVTLLFNDKSSELAFRLQVSDEVSIYRLSKDTAELRYGTWSTRNNKRFISYAKGSIDNEGSFVAITQARHLQHEVNANYVWGAKYEEPTFTFRYDDGSTENAGGLATTVLDGLSSADGSDGNFEFSNRSDLNATLSFDADDFDASTL